MTNQEKLDQFLQLMPPPTKTCEANAPSTEYYWESKEGAVIRAYIGYEEFTVMVYYWGFNAGFPASRMSVTKIAKICKEFLDEPAVPAPVVFA